MRRTYLPWIIVGLVIVLAAGYAYRNRPGAPAGGQFKLGDTVYKYTLPRSHPAVDAPVRIQMPDTKVTGTLAWKRHATSGKWTYVPMNREGADLVGVLPRQPVGASLDYRLVLQREEERLSLAPVTLRFHAF